MNGAGDDPDWLVPFDQDVVRLAAIKLAADRVTREGFVVVLARHDGDLSDLPPSSVEEIAAAKAHRDPAGFRLRRRIARGLAGAILQQPAASIVIAADADGAPVIAHPSSDLHLSFASSGATSLIGLARQRIGVDLEPMLNYDAIPWNILRADEQEAIRCWPEEAQPLAFLRLWVPKEAYLKAIGSGFNIPPETIRVQEDRNTGILEVLPPLSGGHTPTLRILWLEREGPSKKRLCLALSLLSKHSV